MKKLLKGIQYTLIMSIAVCWAMPFFYWVMHSELTEMQLFLTVGWKWLFSGMGMIGGVLACESRINKL